MADVSGSEHAVLTTNFHSLLVLEEKMTFDLSFRILLFEK